MTALCQIEVLALALAPAQHVAQARDDRTSALVAAYDGLQDLLYLVQVRFAARQQTQRRLGIAEDGGQRLPQLMGQ